MVLRRQFAKCQDVDIAVICQICFDSWEKPTELQPCGHIFCKACYEYHVSRAGALGATCPTCQARVESSQIPNRVIVNISQAIEVKCGMCQWKGTREQSESHTCPRRECDEIKTSNSVLAERTDTAAATRPTSSSGATNTMTENMHDEAATSVRAFVNTMDHLFAWSTDNSAFASEANGAASTHPTSRPSTEPYGRQVHPTHNNNNNGNHHNCGNNDSTPDGRQGVRISYAIGPSGTFPLVPGAQTPQSVGRNINSLTAELPRPWERYNLTQVEYDQLVSIFLYFCSDNTERMNVEELTRMFLSFCYAANADEAQRMFREMDQSHCGFVTIDDMCKWMSTRTLNPNSTYGLSQFQYNAIAMEFIHFDTQGRGALDLNQFLSLCTNHNYIEGYYEGWLLFQLYCDKSTGLLTMHQFFNLHKAGLGSRANRRQEREGMGRGSSGISYSYVRGSSLGKKWRTARSKILKKLSACSLM